MIRLALYLVAFLLPSVFLGMFVLKISPHMSRMLLVILVTAVIAALFMAWKRWRQRKWEDENTSIDALPTEQPKQHNGIFAGLVIFSLLGSAVSFEMNKKELYIENGTDRNIEFTLKYEGKVSVPSGDHTMIDVVEGEDEISYEGKTKKLLIESGGGKYMFNADGKTSFMLMPVRYESQTTLYRDGKHTEEALKESDIELIDKEFFKTLADYLYDAPSEIKVRHSESEVKTLLMKIPKDERQAETTGTMKNEENDNEQNNSEVKEDKPREVNVSH